MLSSLPFRNVFRLLLDEHRKAEAVAAILLEVSQQLDESESALLEMALTQYPPTGPSPLLGI
jgi:hypothetical protein